MSGPRPYQSGPHASQVGRLYKELYVALKRKQTLSTDKPDIIPIQAVRNVNPGTD